MNDGGPAFPRQFSIETPLSPMNGMRNDGMTLRDYFAAAALQGIYANSNDHFIKCAADDGVKRGEMDSSETYSRYAYEVADAMLKAREVK